MTALQHALTVTDAPSGTSCAASSALHTFPEDSAASQSALLSAQSGAPPVLRCTCSTCNRAAAALDVMDQDYAVLYAVSCTYEAGFNELRE